MQNQRLQLKKNNDRSNVLCQPLGTMRFVKLDCASLSKQATAKEEMTVSTNTTSTSTKEAEKEELSRGLLPLAVNEGEKERREMEKVVEAESQMSLCVRASTTLGVRVAKELIVLSRTTASLAKRHVLLRSKLNIHPTAGHAACLEQLLCSVL
mgnify:CR=1 FL=1